MDLIVNSAEVVLAEELAYALPKTGSYVVERKNCSFFPDSGGSYSPTNGTKVIRFRIASQGQWADFKTLKVMFDVSNTGNKAVPLLPIGRAHAFFKRLVISCRGVIMEDISDFNAVSEMFYLLNGGDSNKNNSVEEFGYTNNVKDRSTVAAYPGITADNKTVSFTPMCGLIDIKKYLPLTYVPIEISLELADASDPVVSVQAAAPFEAGTISVDWSIFNPIIKIDLLQLDNGLENSYVEHFSSGKSINIVYETVVSTLQSTGTRSSQINISRSLSKMTGVYMSLRNSRALANAEYHSKPWNTFYAPNKGDAITTAAQDLAASFAKEDFTKIQLQIGSRLFPDTPIKSYSEAFSSLRKSLKIHGSDRDLHSVDINGLEYRTNKFIVGFPTDKVSNLSFTGMNTRNNLITLNIDCEDAKKPTAVFVAITSQQILEISDTGCEVID